MIFHEKFFQCLAGAIPLFLTPQKIGLLSQPRFNTGVWTALVRTMGLYF